MANNRELRGISKKRLKTVQILINAGDWDGAAYMMGYALECALKAVTCKTLHLVSYPENTRNDKIDNYFMTHRFDQLLVVSGMEDIFSSRGPAESWRNWSEFTAEYQGSWTEMRYDRDIVWDEAKIRKLYNNLKDPNYGIITEITRRHKW